MELVFESIERRAADLVWSDFLELECIDRMPAQRAQRREWAEHLRGLAKMHVVRSPAISARAAALQSRASIKLLDALHLASAESVQAVFVTVDRRGFLDRVVRSAASSVLTLDPMQAVAYLTTGKQ